MGNRTERLQIRYRNTRWRRQVGRGTIEGTNIELEEEQVASGTPVAGNPTRRAKYQRVTEAHKRLTAARW